MKFDLKRPCPKCPFRHGMGYLNGPRAEEIARSITGGATFACHQTTVLDSNDDLTEGPNSQMCAGAMIALMRDERPNQIMRIAERLGVLDIDGLDMDADVGNLTEFVMQHAGEEMYEEAEPCNVVNHGCLAPAGYMDGGVAVPTLDREPTECCSWCGEYVCENCSKPEPEGDGVICDYHEDE